MSVLAAQFDLRSELARSWQIPALIVATSLFVAGVARVRSERHEPSPQRVAKAVDGLLAAGDHGGATALIRQLQAHSESSHALLGELQRLLGRTLYSADAGRLTHAREAGTAIVGAFARAERMGVELERKDRLALAEARVWAGEIPAAAETFLHVLKMHPPGADGLRRRLARWIDEREWSAEPGCREELIDGILADEGARPANVAWALEQRVRAQLDAGDRPAAQAALERGAARLKASPFRDHVAFLSAECLLAAGRLDETEAALRELRARWQPRDELWGRITQRLGEISNRRGHPQTALTFFDDVLKSFRAGAIHESSLLGRAESLVALERFHDAVETLSQIVTLLGGEPPAAHLDRNAVRTFLRAAAQRLEGRGLEGSERDAVRFLELSSTLLNREDRQEAAFLHERIGGLYAALGRGARESSPAEAAEFHRAAAEAYLRLATDERGDEAAVTRAVWKALDGFEAAGDANRMLPVLNDYLRQYPNGASTAAALRRLGQTYLLLKRPSDAAETFARVMQEHPRTIDAMQSVTPLAAALLAAGPTGRREAEALLTRFIDQPPGTEALVTPQAPEYREALVMLAGLLHEDQRFEAAITRIEDALGLYPDDARGTRLRYMLAHDYRQSAAALRREAATSRPADAAPEPDEAGRRVEQAAEHFARVIEALAPHDEDRLLPVERTWLRSAYMGRADCLFDLGRYRDAASAYAEALWRYENEPTAIGAALQIAQCQLRDGRRDEARRSLERARWLLKKMPDAAFHDAPGSPGRAYWLELTERLAKSGLFS